MRRRMGAAALDMDAASDGSWQAGWRATVAARLPSQRWPERTVLITAVDAHTGEPVVFDRHSGVDLVDAVAASCSSGRPVPDRGRPVHRRRLPIQRRECRSGRRIRAGAGAVTVRRQIAARRSEWGTQLATQVDELRARGSRVETVFPDSDAEHLFGANAMDPSLRAPAAQAGYDQGTGARRAAAASSGADAGESSRPGGRPDYAWNEYGRSKTSRIWGMNASTGSAS